MYIYIYWIIFDKEEPIVPTAWYAGGVHQIGITENIKITKNTLNIKNKLYLKLIKLENTISYIKIISIIKLSDTISNIKLWTLHSSY